MITKQDEKQIKDLIKNDHDGKYYHENELTAIINTSVNNITTTIDKYDNNTISALVTQYVYYSSKESKYYFNFKRKQTKKKDYSTKLIDSFKNDIVDTVVHTNILSLEPAVINDEPVINQENKPIIDSIVGLINGSSSEPLVKPIVEPAVKPLVESTVKPIVESAVKPIVESAVKPAVESPTKLPIKTLSKNIQIKTDIDFDLEKELENELNGVSTKITSVNTKSSLTSSLSTSFKKNTHDNDINDLEKELMGETKKAKPLNLLQMYKYPTESLYKIMKRTDILFGPYGTQWIHDKQTDDVIDSTAERLARQFDVLRAIKLPDQRTEEWYKMRDGKITASDGGCVLGVNDYEAQYKFILKKTGHIPFLSNEFCYHGKKYEETATLIYEYRMNVSSDEFGLIGHFKHDFLGASPDRICNRYKYDKVHKSKYVGRMVEIKCPFVRKIKMDGPIVDHICPIYYWVQVQLQLECCDLEECDFWQCEIREYDNKEDFVEDTDPIEPFRSYTTQYEKGCLIQLLPKKKMIDVSEGKYLNVVYEDAIFIYPTKIEMTPNDCDLWIAKTLSEFHSNPKYTDYVFDKVIYWKLVQSNNVTILRDRKWFDESLPKLKQMWDYVTFFRNSKEMMDILLKYINTRKIKRNKDIMAVMDKLYNTTDPKYNEYVNELLDKIQAGEMEMHDIKEMKKVNDNEVFVFTERPKIVDKVQENKPVANKSFGRFTSNPKKDMAPKNLNEEFSFSERPPKKK